MRRLLAVLLAAGWVAAGCAALPGGGGATNQELQGPWRPQPLSVDRPTIDASQQACRLQESAVGIQGLATTGRLVAVDARGRGRIALLYVGRGESYLECQVDLGSNGAQSMGSGSDAGGPQRVVAANDVMILGTGGMSAGAESSSSVVGRVGSEVTAVRIVLPSGSSLQASLGGGWFTAWWPSAETGFLAEAFNASGQKVGEVRQ